VKSTSRSASPRNWFPDGLDDERIEALISEVAGVVAEAPAPTSALIDGSAAERRRRRIERRALSTVVRSLPIRPSTNPIPAHTEEIAS
jgi:hypothetical protein